MTMDEALAEAFGEVVRDLRTKSNMSQADLSEATDIARSNISRMERGWHPPTLAMMVRVFDALGADASKNVARVVRRAKKRLEKSKNATE